ncbi:MAG TPA: helix-turn-helix transcriptional regulator [Niastella sp.]
MNEKELKQFHEDQLKKFGMRLREIRKEKKMSQVDLEVASGIYMAEISKMENGLQNIEFLTLSKLAYALNVEIQDFFR